MEIIKVRKQPELLTALLSLDKRMTLPVQEKQHIVNMEKGYLGEKLFDSMVEKLVDTDVIVLNDLLLRISEQSVQIDSLILTSETAYLYEIKNYKGDYQMRSGHLLTLTGQEIGNPLTQLKRTASLLRQLFQQWKVTMLVEPAVIYVNPGFSLYHASPEDPIILPNQMTAHFIKVNRQRQSLAKKHRYLAERLLSEHRIDVPFQKQLPAYDCCSLRKGITCGKCDSFDIELGQRMTRCTKCTHSLSTNKIIVEQVEEFKLLFPNMKMTTKLMHEWCGKSIPKDRITRVLSENYNKRGKTLGSFYE